MSRMAACAAIEPELIAAAIGEVEPAGARRVAEHVDRCRACREELQRYRALEAEVAALRQVEADQAAREAAALARLRESLAELRGRLLSGAVVPSPLGPVLIACSEQGVALVEYLARGRRPPRRVRVGGRELELRLAAREAEALGRELAEYLAGRRTRLGWPLDLRLVRSEFHRRVLEATAAVPYGAVISYAGLAHQIGQPRAVRAAAQALRWNPLPIVIPCHRVVGASGALTGYAGGHTGRKQRLLALEGVPTARARHTLRVRREAMYVRPPGDAEYCLPTCASVDPFPRGALLFASRERAEAEGLRPCTSCRPDLHPLAG